MLLYSVLVEAYVRWHGSLILGTIPTFLCQNDQVLDACKPGKDANSGHKQILDIDNNINKTRHCQRTAATVHPTKTRRPLHISLLPSVPSRLQPTMGPLKRTAKAPQPDANADGETPASPPPPIPHAPSAAHLALTTERETTSDAYKKAQKAEKQHRTRRQAARARTHYAAAKIHIKTAYKEFVSGVEASIGVVGLLHYVLREKMSASPEDKQKRKLERTASKRQKLEEKMRKIEDEDRMARDAEKETPDE
ncbi:hypothetical protein CLAFUW4_11178 [Fulvia fulva]|nr:hypothetical protein CLAFUR4_11183 [Fulvia fulva]KAK4620298.1 hypothetical protein CLAFUR0_11188 [Fulvia fulva]WPV16852.1 hypothetical protein CLAFUW4_11178 [Fulvia fulva]WPV32288.1 hypothetical protein CLAFUW7_11174 [Fulvia fulva]